MLKRCPVFWLFLVCALVSMAGCSGGSSGSSSVSVQTGELSVKITDATTADYQAVYITVDEVKVSMAPADSSTDEIEWITVATPQKTYNLLDLVNGITEELGLAELDAGQYNQLRLMLGETPDDTLNVLDQPHPYANYLIYGEEDTIYELKIPSGYQSGFKIVGTFNVNEDQTTDLVLDFNVVKSVIQAGASGNWLLKPTIKVVHENSSAAIGGTVVDAETGDPISGAIVSAQTAADGPQTSVIDAMTVTTESGAYQLLVNPGTYTVVAGKTGYVSESAEVSVISGDAPIQDFALTAGDGEGTITGTVTILNGEDDQSATVSMLQRMDDGSVVEVATASVANGGQYTFDLPEGLYSMFANVTVNGEEMTMEANDAFVVLDGTVINFDILFENVENEDTEDSDSTTPERVTICHKGRTITISSSALNAHLNHGDVEGACDEAETVDSDSEGEETPTGEETGSDTEDGGNTGDTNDSTASKVTVCHKGREINISSSALEAHLNHGDTLGPCSSATDADSEDENNETDDSDTPEST